LLAYRIISYDIYIILYGYELAACTELWHGTTLGFTLAGSVVESGN
jgi:hypothetical protein